MEFTLYTAALTGAEANCRYPERRKISCAEDLEAAVAFDHVCVAFKNDYRKRENFLSSDVLVMDCDNSHTENPAEWMTMEKFLAIMPEVSMAIVPSRNHMKPKDGKCARPRFHVYFGIPEITEEPCYTELKRAVYHAYPFFDEAALDAARFIYGCPAEKVLWQDGKMTIDQVLKDREAGTHSIPQGQRNNTMSRFAGRVIKRYGATERAYSIFLEEAEKCDPPLADAELNKIWQSAVRFGERIARQEGYVSPNQYNNDFACQGSLKPEDYSDIGQAKVLKREYGDELRYTESTDFLRYNGIYWTESHQEAIGAAEEFLELQLADARDQMEAGRKELQELGVAAELIDKGGRMLEKVIEGSQQKAFQSYQAALAYYAFVMKRRDMRYIISALQALKPMLLIPIQALGEFFTGDQELIDYAQEICGLMAIGKVYVEALVIAYGDGRNGKSTYWNSIARVLGSYCGGISADALTANCKRNIKPEMAELKGKRMVIAAEMEEGVRLSTSVLKQLCSTDEVGGEKKYKTPFTFVPTHTLVLYTNHLPRVGASDEGTWRRLIVIPFKAQFEGHGEIKNYADYLVETAGPAILRWIIEGAEKVIASEYHLTMPKCVQDAIQEYRGQNDWLRHFLEDCCDVDPSCQEKSGALYTAYRLYCQQMNEYTRSTTDFYGALEKAGFDRRKRKAGYFIYGLKLKVTDFL
ncbi:phage/plasmid primase, P4 family [Phascolarctobacterium faecium]|uniref:phage/plasmid primase, P4 family n=1 Tax=Phascolarctobacterium faecium TaxID=33025 RepID=UPI00210D8670|nr:phage/plasmid primase, P4 family [Phascolarctobacterium faecium]MCQ5197043.1 phage/plasmid primase, P4 family [Phascolarctobacterium faecium]